jgi:phosphatidylinositol alpha-mannosyltransferase
MRIAMVSQSYYPRLGGVTEHAHNLSEGLRRLGHEVTIITSGPGPADHDSTVRIGRNVMFPMNGAMVNVAVGLDLSGRLKRQFVERRYDLIHIHCPLEPTLPLAALAAAREVDVPVVGTFHMAAKTSAAYALFASVLAPYARRIDARVVVSQAARRFALRYFPGEYSVIPNGVDFAKFAGSTEVDAPLTDGKTNILYVGRLDVRKQVPWLISSFKKLHSKRPDVRLVIIGRGPTEPLCRLAAMPLAEGAIVFEGAVQPKDLPRFYASCHVFCSLPWQRELRHRAARGHGRRQAGGRHRDRWLSGSDYRWSRRLARQARRYRLAGRCSGDPR